MDTLDPIYNFSKTQIRALKRSIKKWERILAGKEGDHAYHNCACCKLYIHRVCSNCPIKIITGDRNCTNTAWDKWAYHITKVHNMSPHGKPVYIQCEECEPLVEAMLADLYYVEMVATNDDWLKS